MVKVITDVNSLISLIVLVLTSSVTQIVAPSLAMCSETEASIQSVIYLTKLFLSRPGLTGMVKLDDHAMTV